MFFSCRGIYYLYNVINLIIMNDLTNLTNLNISVKFINHVRNDFQFDKKHPDYCGYLNVGIDMLNDELAPQFRHFVTLCKNNPVLGEKILEYVGLVIHGKIDLDETVFHLIEE
jgi:hypothetical protein